MCVDVGLKEGAVVGRGVGLPGVYVGDDVGLYVGDDDGDDVGFGVGLPGKYVGDDVGDDVVRDNVM